MEMPVDILNKRLGGIRDNGDIDFDNTMAAVDIDQELQEKFVFFPDAELSERAEQIEENRGWLNIGEGRTHLGVDENISIEDAYALAENALAVWWLRKRTAELEQEKLAKRPEPGIYQGKHENGNVYFTVVVDDQRRMWVQQRTGGMMDQSAVFDDCPWEMQRINLTDGSISA